MILLIQLIYFMRILVFVVLLAWAAAQHSTDNKQKHCFGQAKQFYELVKDAVQLGNVEQTIDSIEQASQRIPQLLRACGAKEEAKTIEEQFSPVCTKLLAREAKLIVKIMRLYAEDKEKNEKSIVFYSAMLQTIYKTQVQKKCVYFKDHHIAQIKNKTKCQNEAYRLSLIYAKLDKQLIDVDLNSAFVDMGKMMEQIPLFLDGCSQQKLSSLVKLIFPKVCVRAIGDMISEVMTIEHHLSHLEWMKDHLIDFTKTLASLKTHCIALSLLKGK